MFKKQVLWKYGKVCFHIGKVRGGNLTPSP